MHLSDFQDNEWFPDIGATAHITKNPGNMTNLVPNKVSDSVMVANAEQLTISHIGEGKIINVPKNS